MVVLRAETYGEALETRSSIAFQIVFDGFISRHHAAIYSLEQQVYGANPCSLSADLDYAKQVASFYEILGKLSRTGMFKANAYVRTIRKALEESVKELGFDVRALNIALEPGDPIAKKEDLFQKLHPRRKMSILKKN